MEFTIRQFEIIEAACKILTASGVGGLTIKNLAKEMQFSESAIYRHFTSKEDIIVALLNYLADTTDKRFNDLNKLADPEDKFKAMLQEQFEFFNENPHFVVAVFSDGLMEASQRVNETILKIMNVKMKHLLPIIMEGQQKGIFTNTIGSREMMHIVMGSFRLQMFKWRIANFQFDIKQSGEILLESLLTLIKNK